MPACGRSCSHAAECSLATCPEAADLPMAQAGEGWETVLLASDVTVVQGAPVTLPPVRMPEKANQVVFAGVVVNATVSPALTYYLIGYSELGGTAVLIATLNSNTGGFVALTPQTGLAFPLISMQVTASSGTVALSGFHACFSPG